MSSDIPLVLELWADRLGEGGLGICWIWAAVGLAGGIGALLRRLRSWLLWRWRNPLLMCLGMGNEEIVVLGVLGSWSFESRGMRSRSPQSLATKLWENNGHEINV